ncbi:microtubule-associated protein Jupiter-like [Acyrthosiphon pisum]|uniref:Microtubule-associated protein Jupiter n=1 Tax=Acyrthosiphon pisum TaxID=7029 RepID=A0A8R1W6V6_ACYPI|nr:microtubule-associated protein Jupiter-like [Acyrthosiphon pisum]|eukprot:XP_003245677.1 PREDICTED: microtubule-associated protein Jupiter-like [Acyrthosiphon pisum]
MATYAPYRHIELDNIGCGKKKVLKPPGGGSSDIFGMTSCDEVNPHKRGTNQKNLQSSIILGGQTSKHSNDTVAANGNSEKPDGNPVTGEGYKAPKVIATPAQHVSDQSEPAPEQKKVSRVPPGGYSSGLW